jgi:hypothetical protein
MLEPVLFLLNSIHEDDADTRERVVVELAYGRAHHIAPVERLSLEGDPPFFHEIKSHGALQVNGWMSVFARIMLTPRDWRRYRARFGAQPLILSHGDRGSTQ